MKPPLIGLTTYQQKNKHGYPIAALMEKYIKVINGAGGAPLLIPSVVDETTLSAIAARVDGFLFTGGGDLAPTDRQGSDNVALDDVDLLRDASEFTLLHAAIDLGKPFLGICRGIQMVNVALGGSLYSHIPDQFPNAIKHNFNSGTEREFLAHEVCIHTGTKLAEVLGETKLSVNSLHHQGIKVLAAGLIPSGIAPDGLIEALEMPGHPFGIGVQWHPEWLTDQPTTHLLFRAFIDAARE